MKGKNKKRAQEWATLIESELGPEYSHVASDIMVGQFITMYAKNEIVPQIKEIK